MNCSSILVAAAARCLVSICCLGGLIARPLSAAEAVSLRSTKPHGTPVHVTVQLQVGGQLKVTSAKTDDKPDSVPMSVVAQFDYDEQRLDDGADPAHRVAVRYYNDAQTVIKIASKAAKPQLRASRRLVTAIAAQDNVCISSPGGPLSRDELELVEIPANTLLLDRLLPQDDVKPGHRWKPSGDILAQFLCLDSVGHTEVE